MISLPEVIVIDGGMVNAYLLKCADRFILIGTLTANKRGLLDSALAEAGCSAGKLALTVATHGDTDHIANCAYLRKKLGAPIGMHRAEVIAAETGDMAATRPNMKGLSMVIFSALIVIFRLRKSDRFTPDVYLEHGDDLTKYGFEAKVLHLPGHSKGSIGVLTAEGDLFCGDLMTNNDQSQANKLVDDPEAMAASIARARGAGAKAVYPGHGKPFRKAELA